MSFCEGGIASTLSICRCRMNVNKCRGMFACPSSLPGPASFASRCSSLRPKDAEQFRKPRRCRPPAGSVCGLHPWRRRLACREAGPGIEAVDGEMPNNSEVAGVLPVDSRHGHIVVDVLQGDVARAASSRTRSHASTTPSRGRGPRVELSGGPFRPKNSSEVPLTGRRSRHLDPPA